jgi:hypothetical protein
MMQVDLDVQAASHVLIRELWDMVQSHFVQDAGPADVPHLIATFADGSFRDVTDQMESVRGSNLSMRTDPSALVCLASGRSPSAIWQAGWKLNLGFLRFRVAIRS